MENTLEDLAHRLNTATTEEGTTFDAVLTEEGVLEIICSNNDEFPIHVAKTEAQLLAVTPLFNTSEVQEGKIDELNAIMLQLSPAIPLSSIGLQERNYILFGAMPLNTKFENIVHELEVQAENTLEVLDTIESLLA